MKNLELKFVAKSANQGKSNRDFDTTEVKGNRKALK